jgi:hypothetical protein
MKTTETLKELYPKINSLLGEIDNEIKDSYKKIKIEIQKLIIDEKLKFIKELCEGEKLNYIEMRKKYLNDKEKKLDETKSELLEIQKEELLDTIKINDKMYYYENKENGKIFDSKSKPIGLYKDGKFSLD